MDFPVELVMDKHVKGLILKVSSLPIFGDKPVIVPEDKITRRGFFSLTSEYVSQYGNWTVQKIEDELQRRGISNANAYRVIRTKRFTQDKPYKKMETTTFQSYHIPENLVQRERKNSIELAGSCTS